MRHTRQLNQGSQGLVEINRCCMESDALLPFNCMDFQWQQKMAPWQAAQFEWIDHVPTTILGKRISRMNALEYLVLLLLGKVYRG